MDTADAAQDQNSGETLISDIDTEPAYPSDIICVFLVDKPEKLCYDTG